MKDKRKRPRHVLFWIKSVRGTNEKAIYEIPHEWGFEDVKAALEKWCSHFGTWRVSENVIGYGWKPIKVPNRREVIKRYNLARKRKDRAYEQWQILARMLNIPRLGLSGRLR